MPSELEAYFSAERTESQIFLAVGLVTVIAALVFWFRYGDAMSKGIALPLAAIGLIQLIVGGTIYTRTPGQVAALSAQYQANRPAFKAAETPRMIKVMNDFRTYKVVEVAFILIGVTGCLFVAQPFWLGIAMGMLIQGAIMLPFDIFAETRGKAYQAFIARAA